MRSWRSPSACSGSSFCSACRLSANIYTAWGGSGPVGLVFRAVAASFCLLPPTILMGATLPAMSRWVETSPQGVAWLGYFYGGNTGGAVIGSLLAGFYLLRVHDMAIATYVAVALNLAVGALALLVARADAVRRRRWLLATRRKPRPAPGPSMSRSRSRA